MDVSEKRGGIGSEGVLGVDGGNRSLETIMCELRPGLVLWVDRVKEETVFSGSLAGQK